MLAKKQERRKVFGKLISRVPARGKTYRDPAINITRRYAMRAMDTVTVITVNYEDIKTGISSRA